MQLHTKLILSIVASLGLVYGVLLITQERRMTRQIDHIADENLARMIDSQWEAIENLQHACNGALNDAMVEGEMDRFRRIFGLQNEVKDLQELTIFDKKGVAFMSTVPALVKSQLPETTMRRIQESSAPWREREAGSFVLYQPMPVKPACIECHPNYRTLKSGGVYRYRFSGAGLERAQNQWSDFEAELSRTRWHNNLLTLGILSITAASVVAWLVRRQIALPLQRVSTALRAGVGELVGTAGALNTTSENLAEGSQSQAAALEQTSASVEEATAMARRSAEDARHTREAASATRQSADQAAAAMQEMQARMERIRGSAENVGKILKTIDEIAFQTNLLALNAAVEAARAGSAGAGFAVVADEVRQLAQRSAEAARNTAGLAEQVGAETAQGALVSQQVAAHLNDILTKIKNEEHLVSQIAQATQEQNQGLVQINDAISSIDKVTQGNSELSQQTAHAAKELLTNAARLEGQVGNLLVLINGRKPKAPPRPAAVNDASK